MKKYKVLSSIIISLLVFSLFTLTAFANSSWVWISETRPYDVLPLVIVGTLIVEIISIIKFAKIDNKFKVFVFVTLANAISFATPYLVNLVSYSEQDFPFESYLEHWPSYTVGVLFCVVTILIELPIVYFSLKKDTGSQKNLIHIIVITNIITTILVAIVERIFCVGSW